MLEAYMSGDPYLAVAKATGAVPPDGTKASHPNERALFKTVVLGVGYGMEARSLAGRLGISELEARELLLKHRETYPRFWQWSEAVIDQAMLLGSVSTVFGWQLRVGTDANPRSIRNFPMQGNGAEMLRIACCLGTERRIRICAPVHDALLIEAPEDRIETHVAAMRGAMVAASRVVLKGFELRTDEKIIRHPDRYSDQRGEVMWARTLAILEGKACQKSSA
jgi:DNA polymerase I